MTDSTAPLGDDWTPADRDELVEAWTGQRWDLSDRAWLRLWRQHRDRGADRPREPMTLYRGAPREARKGMSWSLTRSRAEQYAARTAGDLWTTQAPPGAVLAVLDHGEVVVDPGRLGKVAGVTGATLTDRWSDRRTEQARKDRRADQRRQRERQEARAGRHRAERKDEQRRSTPQARAARGQGRQRAAERITEARAARDASLMAGAAAELERSRAFLAHLEQQAADAAAELEAWSGQRD